MPRAIKDYKNSNLSQMMGDQESEQKLNHHLKSYQIGLQDRLESSPFSSIIEVEDFSGTGSQVNGRRQNSKGDNQVQLDMLLNDRYELETIKQD